MSTLFANRSLWMAALLGNDATLHCSFLLIVIHFLPPPFSSSPGCCRWPGAWPQPRLCPWQLLPSNRGLAGWTREEPEGLVHMWNEEKGAVLHSQSSTGECEMCGLYFPFCLKLTPEVLQLWSCDLILSCCRMRRSVSTVTPGGRMTQCTTPSITA